MTLISFVVPAYRVQAYLRECLDSILDQPFTDLEVIGVDDCSPDAGGEILAGYAERDPRVRVLRLPENVGLGPARNAGLDRAGGEYVWFLDSDDWLAPECLPAVAARLRAGTPDVLLVDHVRRHWDDSASPSAWARVLPGGVGTGTFALRDRPEVLRLLHVAWNRVLRRDLLLDQGLRFAPGWYEDVSFTYPTLLAAGRIAALDRVCVNYRQRRAGAITRTRDERHVEVFDQWDRVFRWLVARRPALDDLWPAVYERMVWHCLTVLGNGERIDPHLRPVFFARITAAMRRWRPPAGYPVPPGVPGLKQRLVAGGHWRTFTALRVAGRVRDTAGRGVRAAGRRAVPLARTARDAAGYAYYRAELRRPLDPALAVYAAYWYRGYACNPAAVYEAARRLAPQVRGVWIVRRDRVHTLPAGVEYVVAGSRAYHRVLARARWLVNNVNFPDAVRKRPGSVHVQTHHGTPVKVMGLDQQRYPLGAPGMDFAALLRRVDRWDYSVTANSFSTQQWERAYPAGYTTLEYGYPRNDRLVTATAEEVRRLRARFGVTGDEPVVLYAPTHREHLPGYRPPFRPAALLDVLGPGARVLLRSHYFHDREPGDRASEVETGSGRVLDVTDHDRVEEVYLAADVLVTDYSSAMFDYAVLDRPIVVYAPDWAAYRLTRGVYVDVTAEPPGAVATDFAGLLDLFRSGAVRSPAAEAARRRFRARFCALDDGHAAERVVRRVFLGERPHPGTGR
ncbi:bifunctional glycosyltransferase/CDP-glycerol:glycerophosphate glycerophosphotransferase [Micromonospora fluostatini]